MTFEFEVPDLPANRTFCKAGQFASFDFEEIVPGEVVNRTWTISSSVEQIKQRGTFTVSIKKVLSYFQLAFVAFVQLMPSRSCHGFCT